MDINRRIAAILTEHRRPAVLLHRPYPPMGVHTNSKFGGLPTLPAAIEWPRMEGGVRLHFLAQIDCRELPFASELPPRGMLYFFGRDGDEQIWDERYAGGKPWRVIYAPEASGREPERPAPPDLPPVGDSYPRPNWRPFLREGEAAPNVHVEWPIEMRRIDTWPDASALADDDFASPAGWLTSLVRLIQKDRRALEQAAERERLWEAYAAAVEGCRADAFYAASGYTRPPPDDAPYQRSSRTALAILGRDGAPDSWPDRWIYIGLFCRALRAGLERPASRTGIADADARIARAAEWIAMADAAGPATPVPPADRAAFRQWATSMQRGPVKDVLDFQVAEWIVEAAKAAIRTFAHDHERAARITPAVYAAMAPFFEGDSAWGIQFAQMLGHAPSSQQARMTDDPTACLLNLSSDAGLGWMFGDVGEASFWIAPDALARRDFNAAWATLEGH